MFATILKKFVKNTENKKKMAIKLMVDSASDISRADAEKLGITVLPLLINFDGVDYYDGVDITPAEFYEKLIESKALPKTSQITPFRFEEEMGKLTANGDEVLVITLSSKLSGTYAAAVQAAEKFGGKVEVVDSLNAAIGERLLAEYALRLIEKGSLSLKALKAELDEKKKNVRLLALLDTLEYLKKGGRISAAVAFAGEILSLKPVIAVVDGEVKLVGKALGSRKGNNLLSALVEKTNGVDFTMPCGVVYSGTDKTVLEKYLKDSAKLWAEATDHLPKRIIGATIGTHVGPGAVGVAFFEK